jgi:transmembrane sensor
MPHNEGIAHAAAANNWLIRQRDPDFADCDDFISWLEADPAHAAIYDELALLDHRLDDLADLADAPESNMVGSMEPSTGGHAASRAISAAAATAANDDGRGRWSSSRRWFGGALAAALIAAIAIPNLAPLLDRDVRRIETAAGQQESITLADGSRIDINGDSVLELVENRPRYARLTSGEAMFHIVHRDDEPFLVETQGANILDLGTAFNVKRQNGETTVAVSEGVVVFNPKSDNVKMRAGQALVAPDKRQGRLRTKSVDVAAVGGWRDGLLVYNGAPLSQVAADLHRTTGMDVSVSVDAADINFRGALSISTDSQQTIEDLAALSGTRALKQGRGWMLSR